MWKVTIHAGRWGLILTACLLTIKLLAYAMYPELPEWYNRLVWFWVFAPLWMPAALIVQVLGLVALLALLVNARPKHRCRCEVPTPALYLPTHCNTCKHEIIL